MRGKLLACVCCFVTATAAIVHAATPGLFVNGGELYFLRTKSEFDLWYHYLKHRIVFDINWPDGGYEHSRVPGYISGPLQFSCPERVSQGFGITDVKFVEGEGTHALSQNITAAMNRVDDYAWFAPEKYNYLTGAPEEWVQAVAEGVRNSKRGTKLVLLGNFSEDEKPKNTPQFIAANRDALAKLPFDGFTVYLRQDFETYDQGLARKLFSAERIRRSELRRALAPLMRTRPKFELFLDAQLFLAPDVFDDAGWRILIGNAQRMAGVLPEAGFAGIFLDTENYAAEKGWMAYSKLSLKAAQEKAFQRGKDLKHALGDLTVITTVAPIYPMTEGHPWGKNYELLGPFVAGMVDATAAH